MPLILVQNEITVDTYYEHWKDIEGVQYHFPNQYKNRIKEGDSFIYYKGSRRGGGIRMTPEYFGVGKIGKKRIDPESIGDGSKSQLNWFCDIVDYIPFINPVPFKVNDNYFEKIPNNMWGVGVREISEDAFQQILAYAKFPNVLEEGKIIQNSLVSLDKVNPTLLDKHLSLIIPQDEKSENLDNVQTSGSPRFSKFSKLYGDRSEEIVFRALTNQHEHQLRWVSKAGEKPGWDIEFLRHEVKIAIEVKGTSGKRFKNLEITAGEWKAAEIKREHYNLYLVADCLGTRPLIQVINNPYELYLNKKISITPTNYRMSFKVAVLQ